MIFIRNTNNLFESNIVNQTPSNDIDTLYETILNDISNATNVPKDVMNSFNIQKNLNPDIWTNNTLNPKIRVNLVKIGVDFFKSLELPDSVKLKDIILTGSLANYNWSKFSDIDLHLVIDFSQIDSNTKFVEDFFYAHKSIWNQTHDISIVKYPVEIYVQDINAKLVATAVYSVLFNKWLLKPEKENINIDIQNLKSKAEKILNLLKIVKKEYDNQNYQSVIDKVEYIKNKIKNMRTTGLEKEGEFSNENILFKIIRRTPFMDYLDEFKNKSYDNLLSIAKPLNEAIYNKHGVLLIYGKPLEDGTRRLYVTLVNNAFNTYDRFKKDNSDGKANRNVTLGNQIFRVSLENGKLKANGVAWSSPDAMKNALNLNTNNVGINYNKTPLHQDSLTYNNIPQALIKLYNTITDLPLVKWVG